ncbi:hypothetical protein MKW94_024719 [Papaver nudicaule]|uniref:Bet v I/Major latex protein domain-containing protein n=1 Tax=Papaver nudicaule TaxID=74823 RepID=A0AA41SI58_PAPNU|nr:hypothetical protein [Papaver nudicaule]
MPHIYTSVNAVEGHGTTSGCIKEWCYNIEGKPLTDKEKTTYDDETRTIHHSAVEGDLMNDYKKFDATLVVNPKADGHGSIVKWIIEYEKKNEDSPVPIPYLETSTYTDEKRMIHHNAIGGDMINDYKKFYLILVVTPKSDGHGSIVQWTIEYEKKNEDSPDPIPYITLCTQITEGLNAHLCASE